MPEQQGEDGQELRSKIQTASREALRRVTAAQDRFAAAKEVSATYTPDRAIGLFLEQGRSLLEEGTRATEWNDEQLRSFALKFDLAVQGFMSGVQIAMREVGRDQEPRTECFQCVADVRDCYNQECPPGGPRFPCFCCVPCNVVFIACIAGCVT